MRYAGFLLVLLGFFGTAQPRDMRYTKYIIVDEVNLRHRTYPAGRSRQGYGKEGLRAIPQPQTRGVAAVPA